MFKPISLLAISVVFVANAQIDSVLSFYPLQTGNIWQYWYHYKIAYTNRSESTYVTVKIVGDTLMPNGKSYKVFDKVIFGYNSPRTLFQRVDSVSGNVYSYLEFIHPPFERLTDSLFAGVGDYFGDLSGSRFKCQTIDTITVFGIRTVSKLFSYNTSFSPDVTLACGFGIIRSKRMEDNPVYPIYDWYVYDLVYMKINGVEYGTLTNIEATQANAPSSMSLEQNYPNPFNPTTKIEFDVSTTSFTTLKICDVLGREVTTLVAEILNPGHYRRIWNADNYSSGVYFYSLTSNSFRITKKGLLQK